jgi:hypothetical protein
MLNLLFFVQERSSMSSLRQAAGRTQAWFWLEIVTITAEDYIDRWSQKRQQRHKSNGNGGEKHRRRLRQQLFLSFNY